MLQNQCDFCICRVIASIMVLRQVELVATPPIGVMPLETGLFPPMPSYLAQTITLMNVVTSPWYSCATLCLVAIENETFFFLTLRTLPKNLTLCFIFAYFQDVEFSVSSQSVLWRQLFTVRLVRARKHWTGHLFFIIIFFNFIFHCLVLPVALCKIFLEKGSFTAYWFLKLFSSLGLYKLSLFQSLTAIAGQYRRGQYNIQGLCTEVCTLV